MKPFGSEDWEGRCGILYELELEKLDCTAAAAPEDLHVGFWFLTIMGERLDASFEGRICLWPVPRSLLPPVDVTSSAACVPSQPQHAACVVEMAGSGGVRERRACPIVAKHCRPRPSKGLSLEPEQVASILARREMGARLFEIAPTCWVMLDPACLQSSIRSVSWMQQIVVAQYVVGTVGLRRYVQGMYSTRYIAAEIFPMQRDSGFAIDSG